jgi:hypothetical protein
VFILYSKHWIDRNVTVFGENETIKIMFSCRKRPEIQPKPSTVSVSKKE